MASSLLLEIMQANKDSPDSSNAVDWVQAWQVLEHHRRTVLRHNHNDRAGAPVVVTIDSSQQQQQQQQDPEHVDTDVINQNNTPTLTSLAEHVDEQGWSALHHAVTAAVRQPLAVVVNKKDSATNRNNNNRDGNKSSSSNNNSQSTSTTSTTSPETKQREQKKYQRTVLLTLLDQNPDATALQAIGSGWTPLHCAVQSRHIANIERDAKLCKTLLKYNPAAALLNTSSSGRRRSPLALHIATVSRLMMEHEREQSALAQDDNDNNKTAVVLPSTTLLQLLAPHCSLQQLHDALQVLYECNTTTILSRLASKEQLYHTNRLQYGRQTRPSVLDDCWVWTWVLALLKAVHTKKQQLQQQQPSSLNDSNNTTTTTSTKPAFRALHTASQITDCPVPFLLLALRAHPTQVRMPHSVTRDFPLHSVAQWQPASSLCRKSMALTELVAAYRKALQMENADGRTPVELEALSGAVID